LAADANRTALPRPLLVVGIPVAGVLLVAFFVYLGFPYAKLGDRIASEIQRNSGVRIDFDDIGASPQLAAPGIEATGVRATLNDGRSYRIERAMLRPAWSLAWFRGTPAIYAEIESDLGDAEGTMLLGKARGWSGELTQIAVGQIPIPPLEAIGNIDGRLDASIDLVLAEAGPEGHLEFAATKGSVGLAKFPIDIPFETLSGELVFGGENYVSIESLELDGPMLTASLTGNVLKAEHFAEAPMRLEAKLTAEPNLRPAIVSAGVRVDRQGKSTVRITGTVDSPMVR
jgi:type II secretion system protein N